MKVPDGYALIFRAYYTSKNGNRVYAKWFGLRAWPILIKTK